MSSINNVERFRQRLSEGKPCLGLSILLSDPLVSELAVEAGYDFTWIETEHSYLDLKDVLGHILTVRGTNVAPLVRVRVNEPAVIKPYLDLAPAGIIVPQIRSAADAQQAVEACKYPPQGVRGFGPIRNMRYGNISDDEYMETAGQQIMVFVQVEHIDAVNDVDAILATADLDGIVLGRNDLSGSLGKLGQKTDPQLLEAIDTVLTKAAKTGLFVGTAIGLDLEAVENWTRKGMRWFCIGDDYANLYDQTKANAQAFYDVPAIKRLVD